MATFNTINSNIQGNNTFLGSGSGNITLTGDFNVGLGSETLNNLTTGAENVGLGYNVLTSLTTGSKNVCLGNITGTLLTTGTQNTILGSGSGAFLDSGNNNIIIGYLSGSNYTTNESDNIIIANGYSGVALDTGKIVIGVSGVQTTCEIAGSLTAELGLTAAAGDITATTGNVIVTVGNVTASSGSINAGTTLSAVTGVSTSTGDITATAGNLALPNTNGAGTEGEITFGGNRWISNFGTHNTFVGEGSGNTTLTTAFATGNIGIGYFSLPSLTSGTNNVSIGSCLNVCNTGSNNIAIGISVLNGIGAGAGNIGIGDTALTSVNGNYNIGIGGLAGNAYTGAEASNICLQNIGVLGESHVMRLGTTGAGDKQVNKCFIAGTTGVTPAGTSIKPVVIDENGQLGTGGLCMFSAYNNAAQANVTGDGTVYTVQFNTELFDVGGNFAASTFTAPVAGKYMLTTLIALDTLNPANTYAQVFFDINGTINSFVQTLNGGSANVAGQLNLGGTIFIPLNASDTVVVKVGIYGSTKTVNVSAGSATSYQTLFSGYLVG